MVTTLKILRLQRLRTSVDTRAQDAGDGDNLALWSRQVHWYPPSRAPCVRGPSQELPLGGAVAMCVSPCHIHATHDHLLCGFGGACDALQQTTRDLQSNRVSHRMLITDLQH